MFIHSKGLGSQNTTKKKEVDSGRGNKMVGDIGCREVSVGKKTVLH